MPCSYNPLTNEVETLYERYQREYEVEQEVLRGYTTEEILYQQSIDDSGSARNSETFEKIDNLKEKIKLSQGENTNAKT